MIKVSPIRVSAQARLLIYRLFAVKLTTIEERLLSANPNLWEQMLLQMDEELASEAQRRADRETLHQGFNHIERSTREGLQKQVERLTRQSLWLGVHSASLLDEFIEEHLKLIKSVQHDQLEKIGFMIKRGIRDGRLAKDITKDIRQATMLSKRRAQLIARNGPLQYSGALTRHNQTSAGIKSYVWQSSRDERVRDSHKKYDGEIFDWNSSGPHPRSEVNCRCDAVPFLNMYKP